MAGSEKVTIVWKSSSPLIKGVLAVLIVFSMAALVALGWVHAGIRSQTQEMRQQAQALIVQNEDLERKIAALGTDQSIREIARDELGMVSGNTILVQPE